MQVAFRAWELCCQVAYWVFITWQLMQALGSWDKYDKAFDAFTKYTNKASAAITDIVVMYVRNLPVFIIRFQRDH